MQQVGITQKVNGVEVARLFETIAAIKKHRTSRILSSVSAISGLTEHVIVR